MNSKTSKTKTLVMCEGESEYNFLKVIKRNEKLKDEYGDVRIELKKSWGQMKRIKILFPGFDFYILVHDNDDPDVIPKLKSFKKEKHILLINNPNFDYFCGEFLNLKFNKNNPRDVIRKIREKLKDVRGKNVDYEKMLKLGSIVNIKNEKDFGIIKLLNFDI